MVGRGRWIDGCRELRSGPFRVASSTRTSFAVPRELLRVAAAWCCRHAEAVQVETDEPEMTAPGRWMSARAEVVCCVQVPGAGGRRMQEIPTVTMMTARCSGWLAWDDPGGDGGDWRLLA